MDSCMAGHMEGTDGIAHKHELYVQFKVYLVV